MLVKQALDGDVIFDAKGKVWHKDGEADWQWSSFDGPVSFYGEYEPGYGPADPVTLLVRDGALVGPSDPQQPPHPSPPPH